MTREADGDGKTFKTPDGDVQEVRCKLKAQVAPPVIIVFNQSHLAPAGSTLGFTGSQQYLRSYDASNQVDAVCAVESWISAGTFEQHSVRMQLSGRA